MTFKRTKLTGQAMRYAYRNMIEAQDPIDALFAIINIMVLLLWVPPAAVLDLMAGQ